MENEKDLIQRAIAGDQMAYRELYQIHERSVRGRVSGYFKWKADVDDVVSESFQKAFSALSAFDMTREFRPWLLTIATRTALDHLSSIQREDHKKEGILHKATEGDPSSAELTDTTPEEEIINDEVHQRLMHTPEEEIINDEVHQRLMQYIDELPSLYKDVMIKYMIEELEYEEIAQELGLELNTVRTRIRRGKQHLAQMMLRGEVE